MPYVEENVPCSSTGCRVYDDVPERRILAWSDRRLVGVCAQATGIPLNGAPVFLFFVYHNLLGGVFIEQELAF